MAAVPMEWVAQVPIVVDAVEKVVSLFTRGDRDGGADLSPLTSRISELSQTADQLREQNFELASQVRQNAVKVEELASKVAERDAQLRAMAESNNVLKQEMERVQSDLATSLSKLSRLTQPYDELVAFLKAYPPTLLRTDKAILVGPPGSGKTTFLKLCGFEVEPSTNMFHGTRCFTSFLTYGSFLDTVGVQYSYEDFTKLCAIFLRDGFPASIVLMSARVLGLLPLLQAFFVSEAFFCPLNAGMLNSMYVKSGYTGTLAEFVSSLPSFIGESVYQLPREEQDALAQFPSISILTHTAVSGPLRTLASFEGTIELLSNLSLPVLAAEASTHDVVRINVFQQYKRLLSFKGTLTEFLSGGRPS